MTVENAIKRLEDSEQELSYSQRLAIADILKDFTLGCYDEDTWIDMNKELPKSRHTVLAYYKNCYTKGRTVKAIYVEPFDILAEDFYEDWMDFDCDYSDEKDNYYVKSGWYESIENGDYAYYKINDRVLFWKELPKEPK